MIQKPLKQSEDLTKKSAKFYLDKMSVKEITNDPKMDNQAVMRVILEVLRKIRSSDVVYKQI